MYLYNNEPYIIRNSDDRQFVFPFLVGALTGGAAIGLTRPRPIYNVAPQQNYPNSYGGYPPYYGGGYYNYGYNPYPPYYR